jgi:hypothetical protein
MANWIARPKGKGLGLLLAALRRTGIDIKWSSFDAIVLPAGQTVDFTLEQDLARCLDEMVFVEIKSANQGRVTDNFDGFFFALTESEIKAADALGERHRVALFNKRTGRAPTHLRE